MATIFTYLTFGVFGTVVGGTIGLIASKFYYAHLRRKERAKLLSFLSGEAKNTYNLDGEIIDIKIFITKDMAGEIHTEDTSDIHKKVLEQAPKREKKGFFSRIMRK